MKQCEQACSIDPPGARGRSRTEGAMNRKRNFLGVTFLYMLMTVCTMAIVPGDTFAYVQSPRLAQVASPRGQAAKIPHTQVECLLASIALYPDTMLAQTLASM